MTASRDLPTAASRHSDHCIERRYRHVPYRVPPCCGRRPSLPLSQAATSAPLIERSIERATGIVYNITGGKDLTLQARVDRLPSGRHVVQCPGQLWVPRSCQLLLPRTSHNAPWCIGQLNAGSEPRVRGRD